MWPSRVWCESAGCAEDHVAQRGSKGSQRRGQKSLDGWFLGQAEPVLMAGDRPMRRRRTLRPGSPNMAGDRIAEMAGRQGSPYAGKLPARPAGKPGDFFIVEGEFATFPSTPPGPATIIILGAQDAFSRHGGIYLVRWV